MEKIRLYFARLKKIYGSQKTNFHCLLQPKSERWYKLPPEDWSDCIWSLYELQTHINTQVLNLYQNTYNKSIIFALSTCRSLNEHKPFILSFIFTVFQNQPCLFFRDFLYHKGISMYYITLTNTVVNLLQKGKMKVKNKP